MNVNDSVLITFVILHNYSFAIFIFKINKEGDSILHLACRKCNMKVIRLLIMKGANLNCLNSVKYS